MSSDEARALLRQVLLRAYQVETGASDDMILLLTQLAEIDRSAASATD